MARRTWHCHCRFCEYLNICWGGTFPEYLNHYAYWSKRRTANVTSWKFSLDNAYLFWRPGRGKV